MRHGILLGGVMAWMVGSTMAFAACRDDSAPRLVDRGLHRQWIVERDRAHPERPAALVEVPWDDAAAPVRSCGGAANDSGQPRSGPSLTAADVRPGMRVSVYRQDAEAEVHLAGVALGSGRTGDVVSVRAGWHGAVLRGVVRGPALVEMLRQSGGKR